jgi:hypothetical protein
MNTSAYTLGRLTATAFQKIDSKTSIAGDISYNATAPATKNRFTARVGISKLVGAAGTTKTRLSSNGHLAASVSNKLSDNVQMIVSTDLDMTKVYSEGLMAVNFGYKIKLDA